MCIYYNLYREVYDRIGISVLKLKEITDTKKVTRCWQVGYTSAISLLILMLPLWSSVPDSLSSRLRRRALSSSNNEKDTSHATRTQERFYRINEGWLKELIGKENNKNNPACHCVRTFLWLSLSLSLSFSLSFSTFTLAPLLLLFVSFSFSLSSLSLFYHSYRLYFSLIYISHFSRLAA